MKIRMRRTRNGSPNGIVVRQYEKDKEYDVPDRLGNIFIKAQEADKV